MEHLECSIAYTTVIWTANSSLKYFVSSMPVSYSTLHYPHCLSPSFTELPMMEKVSGGSVIVLVKGSPLCVSSARKGGEQSSHTLNDVTKKTLTDLNLI